MRLYDEVKAGEVLERVIRLAGQTQKLLIVTQGEDDHSRVQPDERYFETLRRLGAKGIRIVRCYFGAEDVFEAERKHCPQTEYVYCGGMEKYQRAVISDLRHSMAKIGDVFVCSAHPLWQGMLLSYLEECAQKKLR